MDGEESKTVDSAAPQANTGHSDAKPVSKEQREEREIGVVALFIVVVVVIILIFTL